MQFQESRLWLKSIRRTASASTRGNRRAILCVETMEGRLSLSAMPLLPAVQKPSVHFNPQPDPPSLPVHLGKQPAIIGLCPSDPRP
jgi:hypothetical protein